jgi:hypothetical protein
MTTNWKAGDRAVCIRTSPWRDGQGNIISGGPVKDTIYLVNMVSAQCGAIGLWIATFDGWWDADDFRKVVPKGERATNRESTSVDNRAPLC